MPVYRAIRQKVTILDAIRTPDFAAQITLQPIPAFSLDATSPTQAARRAGHIFNLGNGILPGTPVETISRLTDHIHKVRR